MLLRLATLFCVAMATSRVKKLLLEDNQDILTTVQLLSDKVESMEATVRTLEANVETTATGAKGSTYVRWGRTVCDANGTELVYTGYAGGNYYRTEGGAADFICLTDQPVWGEYDDVEDGSAKVYGAEYQMGHQFDDGGEALFGKDLHQHDVPCAVCRTTRATTLMTPGTNQCAEGWNMEYWGYLVTGYEGNPAASNYACLDHNAETETGDIGNDNGKLVYVAEAVCGTLKCPPYVENREITCAVCSL